MAPQLIKYNPAFLGDEKLIESFAVRHKELESILEVVRENKGPSNQHLLIIGPRGIGKTSLVLRVAAEVRREEVYKDKWYPLVFGEESYQVGSAGEFWLEAIDRLAEQTHDERWRKVYEELKREKDEGRLRDRALGQLMDFSDEEGKRILLVVENLNMIFDDQMKDDEGWVIRHSLQNEPRLMLLGTATKRLDETEKINRAMFDQFKIEDLKPLDEKECGALWQKISGGEPVNGRMRSIEILTGGNPRLLVILMSFMAKRSFQKLMEDLTQLIDEHTDYFKGNLENLPPKERKVFVGLLDLWDPASAKQVAEATRLGVSETSSLLKRLTERGAVTLVPLKGRKRLYQVAERLYNIYHLMRRRGSATDRVKAVVKFMVVCYEPEELGKIVGEACQLEEKERTDRYAILGAILDECADDYKERLIKHVPSSLFELSDFPKDLDRFKAYKKAEVIHSIEDCAKIAIDVEFQQKSIDSLQAIMKENPTIIFGWALLGSLMRVSGNKSGARQAYDRVISLDAEDIHDETFQAYAYQAEYKQYKKAKEIYEKILNSDQLSGNTLASIGSMISIHGELSDIAVKTFEKAYKLDPDCEGGWVEYGDILVERGKYEEAEKAYKRAIEIDSEDIAAWGCLGELLDEKLERFEEAEGAYRKVLAINPNSKPVLFKLGSLLLKVNKRIEAIEIFERFASLEPDIAYAWQVVGSLQEKTKKYKEAVSSFRKAIEIDPDFSEAWSGLTYVGMELEGEEGASRVVREYLARENQTGEVLNGLALVIVKHELSGGYSLADQCVVQAIGKEPENPSYRFTLALVEAGLGRWDKVFEIIGGLLDDGEFVKEHLNEFIGLFVDAAAAGEGKAALAAVRGRVGEAELEPLVVGLERYVGIKGHKAQEIEEVAKDIVKRIEKRKDQKEGVKKK